MFAGRNIRVKSLMGVALGLVVLATGVWAAPAFGGASEAAEDQTLSVSINVPLNEIQDGQFCQAYAVVQGGTAPYEFEWKGQFDNSDVDCCGPLGDDQIVNGFIDGVNRPDELEVVVNDTINDLEGEDDVNLNIDPNHPYNAECEA